MKGLQVLALLPAVSLAQTPPVESQDQYRLQQAVEVTALANTTLCVRNELPVRVAVEILHTRGRGGREGFARNTYTWGVIDPNKTSNDINVTYETCKSCRACTSLGVQDLTPEAVRKAEDWWDVKIMFENPKWNVSALDCDRSIFIDDPKPTVAIRGNQARFEFGDVHWVSTYGMQRKRKLALTASQYWTEPFSFVEANKRRDPTLNSFLFVEVR